MADVLRVKSPAKRVVPHGKELGDLVIQTAALVSRIVGSTLGPGGRPVLIEPSSYGLPPVLTKDGVTVFRAIGLHDAVAHNIVELMRDVATRTVNEAGDGTTSSTVLAEVLIRRTREFCAANPDQPPQSVVYRIREAADRLQSTLRELAVPTYLGTPEGDRLLKAVAEVAANGDADLADAVMRCFGICGDLGNVTILEQTGNPSRYAVSKVRGYPIEIGYEDGLGKFSPVFVNRPDVQQCVMDDPVFVLYFGRVLDLSVVLPALEKLAAAWEAKSLKSPNVVFVATAWSDRVIEQMARNWADPYALNIYPVAVPLSALEMSQRRAIEDLAAVVACQGTDDGSEPFRPATIFDPATRPLSGFELRDAGNLRRDEDTGVWGPAGVTSVEFGRHRSTVLGVVDDDVRLDRIAEVEEQVEQSVSTLDKLWNTERLAKLSEGIAQLTVVAGSNGELKERRDRADDAVCAVRAAVKRPAPDQPPNGCLPGSGYALVYLAAKLTGSDAVGIDGSKSGDVHSKIGLIRPTEEGATRDPVQAVLAPALCEPAVRVMENVGLTEAQIKQNLDEMFMFFVDGDRDVAYDVRTRKFVKATETGLVDSYLAVSQTLANAVSISGVLGTIGGAIVQVRDYQHEVTEARDAADFQRMVEAGNPADQRA